MASHSRASSCPVFNGPLAVSQLLVTTLDAQKQSDHSVSVAQGGDHNYEGPVQKKLSTGGPCPLDDELGKERKEKHRNFRIERCHQDTLAKNRRVSRRGVSAWDAKELFFNRSACTPSQTRYTAPTHFTTVKAVADAARIADSPTAASRTCKNAPVQIPNMAANPERCPFFAVCARMKVMSGPGDRFSSTAAVKNVAQWANV